MRESSCRLHVPNDFDRKAGFDVDSSCVFPQGVLVALTLVNVELELEWLKLAQVVRQDFYSA